MHLLQAGVAIEIIALWLGHEQLSTTHGYLEADLNMKKETLAQL
jgi:site-specific recombinase XerD